MFLQVCPVCEHRNPRGSRFCNDCGSPLQLRFCPHCHAAEDVMALECGTCGERLPMLILTDSTIDPEQGIPASAPLPHEPQPPQPAPLSPQFDHAASLSAVAPDDETEATRPFTEAAHTDSEAVALDLTIAADPALAQAPAASGTRGPSIIERFNATQPKLDLAAAAPVLAAAQATESDPPLQAESLTEIAVSEEAETLVEASVAPLHEEPTPVEADVPVTRIDDIAEQLRESVWQHALPDSVEVLPPAVIPVTPPPVRRLDWRRVGLAAGSAGVIAAALLLIRAHPGAGQPAAETTAPPSVVAKPAVAEAAGVTAAPAAAVVTVAHPAPAGAADTPPSVAEPTNTETPANVAQATAPAPAALPDAGEAESKQTAPAARRTPAPARAATETPAPTGLARRAATVEPPRACTAAIAALGLCTLDAAQETN